MIRTAKNPAPKYRAYTRDDLVRMPQMLHLSPDEVLSMRALASVLPFRVNGYVLDELIDWDKVPEDPIFQLTFPQEGMLESPDFQKMRDLVAREAPEEEVRAAAREIQIRMNPHPAGQTELNVPRLNGRPIPGMQHKYRETVLFFPSQGQTCHAYCTYCFRWAQFVGIDELRFASREASTLARYVRRHPEVNSVLITGGDPLIMRASVLRRYIEPLLAPGLEHLVSIRIGTKATAYWPYRFLTDTDADDLLRLFEKVRRVGKSLAIMSHYSHPRELSTSAAQTALRRIQRTGAIVRCQSPLVRHVNDSGRVWADLWRAEVQLGAVPYYMFVERNTGPKDYFEVPLKRGFDIFQRAYRRVSGLARTVRGPSMSAMPGKVVIRGIETVGGERVFVLSFIQAREPRWVGRCFFARFDPEATWLSDLKPAFGETSFFYEPSMAEIRRTGRARAWGDRIVEREPLAVFGHVEWE